MCRGGEILLQDTDIWTCRWLERKEYLIQVGLRASGYHHRKISVLSCPGQSHAQVAEALQSCFAQQDLEWTGIKGQMQEAPAQPTHLMDALNTSRRSASWDDFDYWCSTLVKTGQVKHCIASRRGGRPVCASCRHANGLLEAGADCEWRDKGCAPIDGECVAHINLPENHLYACRALYVHAESVRDFVQQY